MNNGAPMTFTHPMIKTKGEVLLNIRGTKAVHYYDIPNFNPFNKRDDMITITLQGWVKVGKNQFVASGIESTGQMSRSTFLKHYGDKSVSDIVENIEQYVIDEIDFLKTFEWTEKHHPYYRPFFFGKGSSDFEVHRAE